MFHLPNLLVVSSTYSTHFSDSVCVRPSVRPTLRHCIGIWLNQSITVLRLIGFSKKKWTKCLQLITKCSIIKNVIPSYKIKVMARCQSSISKCQMSKITYFGNNFVMNSWVFIWFWQKINHDERLCRALKTEFYFQGQSRTKRSTTKYRPNSVFSDHTCAIQGFFQIVFEKYLNYWKYILILFYIN